MEEKKYEAGRVEITSAEYRDLVTEAVESKTRASRLNSENWKLESDNKELEKKLADAYAEIDKQKEIICALRGQLTYIKQEGIINA